MKYMKQLIVYCIAIGIAVLCNVLPLKAQPAGTSEITAISAGMQPIGAEIHFGSGAWASGTKLAPLNGNPLFSPLGVLTPFQLSYFDSTLGVSEWGDELVNPYFLISLGERFTLPTNSGFVDSVTLQIDSITADSITVALFPDTLLNVNGTDTHIMNVFDLQSLADLDRMGYAVQTIPITRRSAGSANHRTFSARCGTAAILRGGRPKYIIEWRDNESVLVAG
jgi:hypothetical protein